HRHAERAVTAPIGPQAELIAIRQGKHRKIRRYQLMRTVKFERATYRRTCPVDAQVVETNRLAGLYHRISGARLSPGLLHPTGQQVIDLYWREIGLNAHSIIVRVIADASHDLDRNSAGHGIAKVDAKPPAGGLVERCLQTQIG